VFTSADTYDVVAVGPEGSPSDGYSMQATVMVEQLFEDSVPKLTWVLDVVDNKADRLLVDNYLYLTYVQIKDPSYTPPEEETDGEEEDVEGDGGDDVDDGDGVGGDGEGDADGEGDSDGDEEAGTVERWESATCSFEYIEADLGKITSDKSKLRQTCGPEELSSLTEVEPSQVVGSTANCGFYNVNL
jgi:hypothetical protein